MHEHASKQAIWHARSSAHTHNFHLCINRKMIVFCSVLFQCLRWRRRKAIEFGVSFFLFLFNYRHSGTAGNTASNEKPFACPVPGCKKRYKNVNGIKYHSKNGHKKEGK